MPRFRPQFTLSTLLLVMVAACLVLSTCCTWYALRGARTELESANQEIREYRDVMGYLDITDPKRLHARQIPSPVGQDPFQWRWRVFVPKGCRCCLRLRLGDIPSSGLPQGSGAGTKVPLGPGEQVIFVGVVLDEQGKRVFALRLADGPATGVNGVSYGLEGPRASWFSGNAGWAGVSADRTARTNLEEPLVLVRFRADAPAEKRSKKSSPGFMLWIEKVADTTGPPSVKKPTGDGSKKAASQAAHGTKSGPVSPSP